MADRDQLLRLLAAFPEKAPLDSSVVDVQDCGSYTRESVQFNVEKDERINAYVLLPKARQDPCAAVFCHHQHAGNFDLGKSEVVGLKGDPSQAYAVEMAERGFITFAQDSLGFEDRNWSRTPGKAVYFELASRLVQGKTLLAKALHDVSVGIDYLCSREEVDSERIGFIGHSFGGRMAIWAPAFDRRIAASVSNCGCTRYKDSLDRDTGIQLEFCVPGIMQWGDIEDVVKMIAPRSLLISGTFDDKWSRGAREIYDSSKEVFPAGHLELAVYEGGHVFSEEMRQAAYTFLQERLG
jgi:dienelactone hydrolase